MKFSLLFPIIGFCFVALISCTHKQEQKIESLNKKVVQLKSKNARLTKVIDSLKHSDKYFYNQITDYYQNEQYDSAQAKSKSFRIRYPQSIYLKDTRTLLDSIQVKQQRRLQQEKQFYAQLLTQVKKAPLSKKINLLQSFLMVKHSQSLIEKAETQLEKYKKQYAAVKSVKEAEVKTGIHISEIKTEWKWGGLIGNKLLCPYVTLKLTNISDASIKHLVSKVSFIDEDEKSVFGEASDFVIGYGDSPLRPGYSKTSFLRADVGYTNDVVALHFPNLVADIYINDVFYKTVQVEKEYGGRKW